MKRIMIIEDETTLRDELSVLLKNAGYEPIAVTDYSNVSEQMKSANSDLILLDINLPNVNGETLLQDFRKSSDTPVIMLTSRTTEIDEVLSMSYGADDYITKPYNPTILLLRISAVLKRSAKVGAVQKYHDVEVSTVKGSLTRNGSEQILTKNEMIIFQQLLDRQGEIVTRDELMTALWDNDEFVNDNALSVNVSRLRGKLAELGLPEAIETRKKQGYVLK
ncbi:DNA-binding response regulator, OmpR family, contains REC and winged-helix (wHTH) domain [Ruminococcus sp. YRD2003]|uniref:response regulator transcription factor n=1 Tax=Ruminococcus sp. YRD2003 TaxID=1452313 RepID=UPI0008BDD050|nr:response regulator transcription factor [uncultured Ruminococcus sp.]SEL39764.1 DNA-binding response regulator, OmpR family, contains REC and winged-helix (wHTH) domain [Ruminococcus flavefaciens]